MGAVAALAGACVAPVVIQAVLSDMYAGDRRSACLAFLLGVGMAIPGRRRAPVYASAKAWCVDGS